MGAHPIIALGLAAVAIRFGLLTWFGYRTGRVKSASPWGMSWDRETQPRSYWSIMGAHALVVFAMTGTLAALAFGLAPISN